MSGYEFDLSEAQEAALKEMKEKLGGKLEIPNCQTMVEKYGGLDNCCLRYLRFYNFNADQAVEKFLATLQWRAEMHADTVDQEIGDLLEKFSPYWPGIFRGFTHDGLPICFFFAGYAQPGVILAKFKEEEVRKYYIYWMEKSLELQRESTKKLREKNPKAIVKGTVEIFDLSGLSWSQLHMPGIQLLARVLSIGTTHYPSNLAKGFIINSGIIFSSGWKIISPVLHAQTRERITVDSGPCKEQLEAIMPPEEVPLLMTSVKPPPAE